MDEPRRHGLRSYVGYRNERLQFHRSCPQSPADGPRRGGPPASRIRGDGAHPPRPDPRGRRGGGGSPHQPERRSRRHPAENRGNGQEGESRRGGRPRPSVHLASQEGARAGHDRGAGAEPLLRRHRAPAAGPPSGREGHRRPGPDRRRCQPGTVAGGDPASAGQRHAPGLGRRQQQPSPARRPSRRRSPRPPHSTISAAI